MILSYFPLKLLEKKDLVSLEFISITWSIKKYIEDIQSLNSIFNSIYILVYLVI